MAQQFRKHIATTAALVAFGFALNAAAQPTPATDKSGGPTPSASKSGGPVPATDKSGGPTPSADKSGGPTPAAGATKAGAKGSLDASDRKFMENAAMGGMMEVEMGKLGQQKGQGQAVKDFAGKIVTDHTKANDELKALASSKGVTLPSSVDKAHAKHTEELGKKKADRFDHEYMEDMVKDHKKDIAEFEKQAKNGKDADVRAFAEKTLPTLREHLKMAQQVEADVKKGGNKGGGAAHSGSTAGSGGSAAADSKAAPAKSGK